MRDTWWTMPGPATYVEAVVRDVRDGKNVVLALPQSGVDGIASSVRDELGESHVWETLYLDGEGTSPPAEVVYTRFVPDRDPGGIYSPQNLARETSFANSVVWVEYVEATTWPRWSAFLSEYAHSVRSKSVCDRSVFCVPVAGDLALRPPVEDVCLSVHAWDGVVDDTDLTLYVAGLVRGADGSRLRRRLQVALITVLAGGDRDLADELLGTPVEDLLRPLPLLQRLATRRGWTASRPPTGWQAGTVHRSDGAEQVHSLLLALDGDEPELMCRIWKAEVTVLFPFVEQCRRGLLDELKGRLRVPYETPFGAITDASGLELGHILAQMENNLVDSSSAQRQRARRLRDVRNALAHFDPLTADHLRGLI